MMATTPASIGEVLDDSFSAWISESHRNTPAMRGACAGDFHMPRHTLPWYGTSYRKRNRQQRRLFCCWIPPDRIHSRWRHTPTLFRHGGQVLGIAGAGPRSV